MIDDDAIFRWSGDEEFLTDNFTGVVMTLLDGWTFWIEDQPSKHRFRFTQGLILTDPSGTDPLGTPTNVVWSLSEQAVSNVVTVDTGGTALTAQQTKDAMTLATVEAIASGSLEARQEDL